MPKYESTPFSDVPVIVTFAPPCLRKTDTGVAVAGCVPSAPGAVSPVNGTVEFGAAADDVLLGLGEVTVRPSTIGGRRRRTASLMVPISC